MAHFVHLVTLMLSLTYLVSGKGYISSDLNFDCASNGSMLIFANSSGNYASIYATGKKNTNNIMGLKNATNTTCSVQEHMYGDNIVFEITGCDTKETIRVIVMHSSNNESEHELLIGGQGVSSYQLKCNEVPIGGYTINKTVNLNKSDDEVYTPITESPFELTMEIKNKQSIKFPVIIGEELHLVISGKHEFEFRVETCIASDGSHTHNKTLINEGSSLDTYILSNFNTVRNNVSINVTQTSQPRHSLEATLYAFHFVDSYDVEIMCIILVCQIDDDTCPLTTRSKVPEPHSTKITTSSQQGRRKRDVLGLPQTQTLRTTFRVVDQFRDNDGIVKTSSAFRRPVFWLPLAFVTICAFRTLT